MARKVRNTYPRGEDISGEISQEQENKVALYARKSKADSESMEAQVHMLREYVRTKTSYQIYHIYIDDGYTGIDFQRPAFKQMIEDMKTRKFQFILVKDSSRIGRNHLEVGRYMEEIFPKNHVKLLAINEQCSNGDTGYLVKSFLNIIHEQYSRDLSRKLSSAFHVRQMDGKYIGTFAPYGYRKDPANRGRLVIDEEAAPVIQELFLLRNQGEKNDTIVELFNKRGILSPMAYRYEKGIVHNGKYKDALWKTSTIDGIYRNPVYYGHMVQGKTRQSLVEGQVRHKKAKGAWITVRGTHPALVAYEENSTISSDFKSR